MTTTFEKREVRGLHRFSLPNPLEHVLLDRCTFYECQAPAQTRLKDRPTIRDVTLFRCHVTASDLGPVIAEDCVIDTIWFHRGIWGPQTVAGSAFKHVTIRGRVTGALLFVPSDDWFHSWPRPTGPSDPFFQANERYYEGVDWALDISQAEFTGIELYMSGIPARLIRRDPETQVVITRPSALEGGWREPLKDHYWRIGVERFLETGFQDTILVACKRGRYFQSEMESIRRLKSACIVNAD